MTTPSHFHRCSNLLLLILCLQSVFAAQLQTNLLPYAAGPADNPYKGFVPHSGTYTNFPHSMEYFRLGMNELMTGPNAFNWEPLESQLNEVAERGHHSIIRIFLEFPGAESGVPEFLIKEGLKLTTWTNKESGDLNHTPQYEDLKLRGAITRFIGALGRKYDGDKRLGFVTMGMLGSWGEWHTYPRSELFASKTVQREVMNVFDAAFRKTPVLMRNPIAKEEAQLMPNHLYSFGYHDDSFAWQSLDSGNKNENWFFETRMKSAGLTNRWRSKPIGGEVRPELWFCLFEEPSCAPKGQDYNRSVDRLHVSWLLNSGVFETNLSGVLLNRSLAAAQRLGYDFHLNRAVIPREITAAEPIDLWLSVTNRGVAPFYFDWPVELAALNSREQVAAKWRLSFKLGGLLPGDQPRTWTTRISRHGLPPGNYSLVVRVPSPLGAGKPLRFANQKQTRDGATVLGQFTVK